jgi:hypothetical protein
MTTAHLKIDLINKITRVQDSNVIKEIKRLLDFELEEGNFKLSPLQKRRISEAKAEVRQKHILTESAANKEIEVWLGK